MFEGCDDGESMTSWNDVEGCLTDMLSLEKPMPCDILILMILVHRYKREGEGD